jgi:hypothetical protein
MPRAAGASRIQSPPSPCVPNKATALLKDAVLKAAETAGGGEPDGLVNYLVAQAKQNPGPFLTLLGKVMPTQISGEDDKTITVSIRQIISAEESEPLLIEQTRD